MSAAAGWLARQLPEHVGDDPFLRRLLALFEELADSVRSHADTLPLLADLDVTPAPVRRWLGTWFGLHEVDESLDPAHQRDLVAGAGTALAWRGTARGLRDLLAAVTGGGVTVRDSGGVHVRGAARGGRKFVWVDVEAVDAWAVEHVVELVRREIPADAGVEVTVGGDVVWSDAAPLEPEARA